MADGPVDEVRHRLAQGCLILDQHGERTQHVVFAGGRHTLIGHAAVDVADRDAQRLAHRWPALHGQGRQFGRLGELSQRQLELSGVEQVASGDSNRIHAAHDVGDNSLHARVIVGVAQGLIGHVAQVVIDHVLAEVADQRCLVVADRLEGRRPHAHLADAGILQTLDHSHGAHEVEHFSHELSFIGEEDAGVVEGDLAPVEARGHGQVAAVGIGDAAKAGFVDGFRFLRGVEQHRHAQDSRRP